MAAANVAGHTANAALRPADNVQASGNAAIEACTARAASYGAVHVINTEQHSPGRVTVWGTAATGESRKSFRCVYGSIIMSFDVRDIPAN
jgi:hypothetical protein